MSESYGKSKTFPTPESMDRARFLLQKLTRNSDDFCFDEDDVRELATQPDILESTFDNYGEIPTTD